MSTIKSSTEHLTLNADGTGKDIILQNNGTTSMKIANDGNIVIGTFSASGSSTGIATAMTSEPRIHTSGSSTSASDVFKFYTPNGEVGKIQTSGSGTLYNTGNGGGIDFSGNSNASGMTSEVLDDYEEGTWTPYFYGTSGSAGSSATTVWTGTYTKVGNLITLQASFRWSDQGSWAGYARIGGLPFTAGSASKTAGTIASLKRIELSTGFPFVPIIYPSTDIIKIFNISSDASVKAEVPVTAYNSSLNETVITIAYHI